MVQRATLQPRLSDIRPPELHAVFCPAGRWGRGLILLRETSLESQTGPGDGWTGGRGAEGGGEEGVKGEVRVSGLTGSRDMNGRLRLLQKWQLPPTE